MKFNLEDHTVALSHVILSDADYSIKIADTPLWKEHGVLEAKLTINGVEFPAELIENVLQNLYSRCEETYKEKYDAENFDARVEERAEELLKEHADNAYEKISNLMEVLNDPSVLLTPHWRRK